mmetsp:Transcript_43705/g.136702  ORF Transcript_43705/g.136702 Transcript_43705/m.136702 type:complete len:281 (-) Transcript_43705:184-1026(-)
MWLHGQMPRFMQPPQLVRDVPADELRRAALVVAGVLRAVHAAVVGPPEQQGCGLELGVKDAHAAVKVRVEMLIELDTTLGGQLAQASVEERCSHARRYADPLLHAAIVWEVHVLTVFQLPSRGEQDRHLVAVRVAHRALELVQDCPAAGAHGLANGLGVAPVHDARCAQPAEQRAPEAAVQPQADPLGAVQREGHFALRGQAPELLPATPRQHRGQLVRVLRQALHYSRLGDPQRLHDLAGRPLELGAGVRALGVGRLRCCGRLGPRGHPGSCSHGHGMQ